MFRCNHTYTKVIKQVVLCGMIFVMGFFSVVAQTDALSRGVYNRPLTPFDLHPQQSYLESLVQRQQAEILGLHGTHPHISQPIILNPNASRPIVMYPHVVSYSQGDVPLEKERDKEELADIQESQQVVLKPEKKQSWWSKLWASIVLQFHVQSAKSSNTKTFKYDGNGNMVQDDMFKYTYDPLDRLIAVRRYDDTLVAEYRYDWMGRRVWKKVYVGDSPKELHYIWSGQRVIQEIEVGDEKSKVKEHVYGVERLDDVVYSKTDDEDELYYHKDALGSVVAVSDEEGDIVERYEYDAYGNTQVQSLTDEDVGNDYRYTGQRYDAETGLYYYKSRYYRPDMGMFMSRDPSGYRDSMNLYTYVANDPVNYTDPEGRVAVPGAAVSVGLGWSIAQITGTDYGVTDAFIDAAAGFVGAGVVSKVNKLKNLSRSQRVLAKLAGLGGDVGVGVGADALHAQFGSPKKRADGSAVSFDLSGSVLSNVIGVGVAGAVGEFGGKLRRVLGMQHIDSVFQKNPCVTKQFHIRDFFVETVYAMNPCELVFKRVADIANTATKAPGGCISCAKNIYNEFHKAGLNPVYREIRSGGGTSVSQVYHKATNLPVFSNDAMHRSVQVGDKIYDAFNPHGVSPEDYLKQFDTIGEPVYFFK